jgi:hypothetical protein
MQVAVANTAKKDIHLNIGRLGIAANKFPGFERCSGAVRGIRFCSRHIFFIVPKDKG